MENWKTEVIGEIPREDTTSLYKLDDIRNSKISKEINIRPLDYGFIINVGCQTVAIESKQDLIKYLTEYIQNPLELEKNIIINNY